MDKTHFFQLFFMLISFPNTSSDGEGSGETEYFSLEGKKAFPFYGHF